MTQRKTAVVTGGGTGIGKAIAIALARAGFDLVIAGRRSATLDDALQEIQTAAPQVDVSVYAVDVGIPEDCESLIRFAVERLGFLSAVVNAAAICEAGSVTDVTAEDWDRTLSVNLRGSALVSTAAARHMRETGGGRIILFSSINGVISEPNSAPYSASKAGVSSLARSMAVDLATAGITVNAVAPGWIRTAMTADFLAEATDDDLRRLNPVGRLGLPEEVASVVLYLAAGSPTFLTGTTLFVDGGQTASAVIP